MLHKSQVFFWLLVSFLSGIFAASVFNVSQVFTYIGLIAAIGLIGIFGYNKNYNGKLFLAGFVGIAFLFGVVKFNPANFNNNRLDFFTDLKASDKNIEVVVNGYIEDEPVNRGNRQEFVLRAKQVIASDKIVGVNDKILVTTGSFPKFVYGDFVSTRGVLKRPENFGEFDYVTYLKKEDVKTTMFYPKISGPDGYYDSLIYHNMGKLEKVKINLYQRIFALKDKFEDTID